jgi:hypothetical protein
MHTPGTAKYSTHRLSPQNTAANTHPVRLIVEYVKILVKFGLFHTVTDVMIIVRVEGVVLIRYEISIMGAAFCIFIISKSLFL